MSAILGGGEKANVGASQAENQKSYANWQGDNAHAGDGLAALGMAGTLLGGIGSGLGTYRSYLKNKPSQKKSALTRQGQALFNSAVLPAYKANGNGRAICNAPASGKILCG